MPDPLDRFPCSRFSSKACEGIPAASPLPAGLSQRPRKVPAPSFWRTVGTSPGTSARRRLTVRAYATACALGDRYVRAHWCANRGSMAATPAAGEQHRGCGDGEHGDNGPKHQRDHPRGAEKSLCASARLWRSTSNLSAVRAGSGSVGPNEKKRISARPTRKIAPWALDELCARRRPFISFCFTDLLDQFTFGTDHLREHAKADSFAAE